jgi:hypothetical protein
MDPEFTKVSDGDFGAVDEFLETGEFQPTISPKNGQRILGWGLVGWMELIHTWKTQCKSSDWPSCTCLQGSLNYRRRSY